MLQSIKDDRLKGILSAVIASALWSTGGLFIKLTHWNPMAITGSRSLIAALVLMTYKGKPKFTRSKPQIFGAIAYALTVLCFVTANKLTTSANAILLQYTSPIFVAILGFCILKERVYWRDIISIAFVFLGMLLFFVDNVDGGNMAGNLIAVFAGLSLAVVTISLRMQDASLGIDATIFGNLLAFLISIPSMLGGLPDIQSIVVIIIMGVFQLGISYVFYINSVKYLSALDAVLLTVVEPLLNPLWVFMFIGEKPSSFAIMGGAIVIISIVTRAKISSRKAQNSM